MQGPSRALLALSSGYCHCWARLHSSYARMRTMLSFVETVHNCKLSGLMVMSRCLIQSHSEPIRPDTGLRGACCGTQHTQSYSLCNVGYNKGSSAVPAT